MQVVRFYFTLNPRSKFKIHFMEPRLWYPHCENRPIYTRFSWKLLINPLRWELTRVHLSTRHVLIHILEALNQHNSPKTIANPVVSVRVCHMSIIKHTYRYISMYIADDPQRAILHT